MESTVKYEAVGIMSGSSRDGVDLALCRFTRGSSGWKSEIRAARTIPYSQKWSGKLREAPGLDGESLIKLHSEYGNYLGRCVLGLKRQSGRQSVGLIASHGHTVFHQPDRSFTFQLGDANAIRAVTGIPVVADFRSLDVMYGGEGAPLVPVGDELLFGEYEACLNLGGISNISYRHGRKRMAFDICFVNMGLNHLSEKKGKRYDHNGTLAASGQVRSALVQRLEKIYARVNRSRPSLGREQFEKLMQPVLDQKQFSVEDRLCSYTEVIARQIVKALPRTRKKLSVLCTGGGAFNGYLMSRLLDVGSGMVNWVIPEDDIVKFKEAMVFAFLGVLRMRGEINCLSSVTGASQDSVSGLMTT